MDSARKPHPRSALLPGDDKRAAAGFSALFLASVLWPITQNWRAEKSDGFPLSYYPMFSVKRKQRYRVTHVVGVTVDDERVPVSYRYAGTGGLNQVRRQLSKIVTEGDASAACGRIAERLARRPEPSLGRVVRVEIVTGEYRLAEYFRGSTEPTRVVVHASHPVEWTA